MKWLESSRACCCCSLLLLLLLLRLLLLAVVNRYTSAPPAVGFIRGFGIGAGAIASSVAHDCHNVVAVGGSRHALAEAVSALFKSRGGLALHDGSRTEVLPLPIAGLMSDQPFERVAADYERLTAAARAPPRPSATIISIR